MKKGTVVYRYQINSQTDKAELQEGTIVRVETRRATISFQNGRFTDSTYLDLDHSAFSEWQTTKASAKAILERLLKQDEADALEVLDAIRRTRESLVEVDLLAVLLPPVSGDPSERA